MVYSTANFLFLGPIYRTTVTAFVTARAINCGRQSRTLRQLIALAKDDGHTPCDKQNEATSLRAQATLYTTVANSRKRQSSLCMLYRETPLFTRGLCGCLSIIIITQLHSKNNYCECIVLGCSRCSRPVV